MPGLMSLKTLLAKAGGVVLSVSGGLACGKVCRTLITCYLQVVTGRGKGKVYKAVIVG